MAFSASVNYPTLRGSLAVILDWIEAHDAHVLTLPVGTRVAFGCTPGGANIAHHSVTSWRGWLSQPAKAHLLRTPCVLVWRDALSFAIHHDAPQFAYIGGGVIA